MKNKKAIVTLAIGKKYEDMFDRLCNRSWREYCEKYSYDLIVIKDSFDNSDRARRRSPAWQKLLILSQDWSSKYDQIVWVDTDIIINNYTSIDITLNIPKNKVGAVECYSIPTREIHNISLQRQYSEWKQQGVQYIDNLTPGLYYENRGISEGKDFDSVIQTGVFVCSQRYHRELFEYIYNNYEDTHGAEWNYEMPTMSYEILRNNYEYWIQPQFNFCVADISAAYYPFIFNQASKKDLFSRFKNIITNLSTTNRSQYLTFALLNIYDLGYFIHFAGCVNLMEPFCDTLKRRDKK